jgi:hypothetical protein
LRRKETRKDEEKTQQLRRTPVTDDDMAFK